MADPQLIELLKQGAKAWNSARAQGKVPQHPDLSGADLRRVRLIGIDFDEADLSNADLTGAMLPYASLKGATARNALLSGAVLAGATANDADFRGAVLTDADLADSTFDGADLTGADLRRAKVDRCRLVGATLVQVLTTGNLDRAIRSSASEVFVALPLDRPMSLSFAIDNVADASWPRVVILVEGHDVFGLLGKIGFAPSEVFSSTKPLVPTDPAQRIAVYRCNCGEAGCGCIAPVIKRVGDEVHWTDFRDFTGVYITPETDPQPDGGRPLPIPTLRFNNADYDAAIQKGARL
jgi:hypothetical protein